MSLSGMGQGDANHRAPEHTEPNCRIFFGDYGDLSGFGLARQPSVSCEI